MEKSVLNYGGLEYFFSKLLNYIEKLRIVKAISTTERNGINLSLTDGELGIDVTPGSITNESTELVTGSTVFNAIQAGNAIRVDLTESGTANQYITDINASEVVNALNLGKDAYIIIGMNYTGYVFKAHSGLVYGGSNDVCYCNTTIDYNYNIILRIIKHSGTLATLYTYILANLNSPEFIGTPTAPTATAGTSTTQIATTEFVTNAINAGAPYIVESTNGVAEKSVTELLLLYYGGTTNLVLRYNGKLYPFITFFDSNSMGWGGLISQTNFGTKTQILTISLTGTALSFGSTQVNIVNSVEDNSDANNLAKYYARREDNGITLTLSTDGTLGIATLNGIIGPSSWEYADLNYFVTGNTVYNAIEPLAPKASPTFTGKPTAPTAILGTNNTQIATTEFVNNTVANAITGKSTFMGAVQSNSEISELSNYIKGQHWLVLTVGTYVELACEVGDLIYCISNKNGTYKASDFTVIQNNLDISTITELEIDALFSTDESSNE